MSKKLVLSKGTKIGKYRIEYLIGEGGFGHVYKIRDPVTQQTLALKTETKGLEVSFLNNELECLENLKTPCFPIIKDKGEFKTLNYYVMNLYGLSINDVRKTSRLQLNVSLPICYQMLKIIQTLHSLGYVHRDIKPSNFLLQQSESDPLVLVDFGCAVHHIDPNNGKPYESTESRFVGTKKYASVFVHRDFHNGRRDDLISWVYSCIEIIKGTLPWANCETIEELVKEKEEISSSDLFAEIPKQFSDIYKYLQKLEYESNPDYSKLEKKIKSALEENEINFDRFNWQKFYIANADLEGKCANAQKQKAKSQNEQKKCLIS